MSPFQNLSRLSLSVSLSVSLCLSLFGPVLPPITIVPFLPLFSLSLFFFLGITIAVAAFGSSPRSMPPSDSFSNGASVPPPLPLSLTLLFSLYLVSFFFSRCHRHHRLQPSTAFFLFSAVVVTDLIDLDGDSGHHLWICITTAERNSSSSLQSLVFIVGYIQPSLAAVGSGTSLSHSHISSFSLSLTDFSLSLTGLLGAAFSAFYHRIALFLLLTVDSHHDITTIDVGLPSPRSVGPTVTVRTQQ